MRLKVLCIMGLFPREYQDSVQEDTITGMQNAANKLQWAIVEGLEQQEDVEVHICNSMYIGSYPRRYKKWRIPSFSFKNKDNFVGMNIGFINLPFVKMVSRYCGIKNYVRSWYGKHSEADEKVVLIYALTTPFTWIARFITKAFHDVKVCFIVPDLPEYMSLTLMEKKGMYYALKSIEIRNIKKSIRDVNYYVLLTDVMKKWFKKPIQYTVMEGIAHQGDIVEIINNEQKKESNRILYAGGVERGYGVADLVSAFCTVGDDEWYLDIYGDGQDISHVMEIAQGNTHIVFHGRVSNETVVREQRYADLLVNPRRNQVFTAYSFPSKILEYMSSGTPMLAYKLDGVPDEYDPFYFHISTDQDGMVKSLREVMALSQEARKKMGKKAQDFVREKKQPKMQCEKIVRLLRSGDCIYEPALPNNFHYEGKP